MNKRLPIGIQDFRTIIEDGYLYLDKTEAIYNLIQSGRIYFLSRPRRFGKTLLVSVLECLFKGERDLFKGLWIEDKLDWSETYPVVRLDMSSVPIENAGEADELLSYKIDRIADRFGVEVGGKKSSHKFAELINVLRDKYGKKAVVLIDEYDSPIISNLSDITKAKQIRDKIRDFYRVLKAEEANLRFIFLTGVSKFSKAGVFSALNNLADITLDTRFATMLGVTQSELESYFEEYINKLAESEKITRGKLIEKIKRWYNGFCFDGKNGSKEDNLVYNPFSTLLLFSQQTFQNYWFESGSPKFLLDLLKQNEYDISEFEELKVGGIEFNSYEPEDLKIEALLLQTGYLTIKDKLAREIYTLTFPNFEIKESFSAYLIDAYGSISRGKSQVYVYDMRQLIEKEPPEFEEFIEKLKAFFSIIPYDIHNRIKNKEQYYQSIIYAVLAMLGLEVRGEIRVAKGRIDLMFELNRRAFIIECKLNATVDEAIDQIKAKGYADAFSGKVEKIYLIGIALDTQERNISDCKWEKFSNNKAI